MEKVPTEVMPWQEPGWQEPGRQCDRHRGATGVQLSKPESPISGFRTIKETLKGWNCMVLLSTEKFCLCPSLPSPFKKAEGKSSAKVKDRGGVTMWALWTVASILIAKESEKKRSIINIKRLKVSQVIARSSVSATSNSQSSGTSLGLLSYTAACLSF